MRKIIYCLTSLLVCSLCISQTNTFPTSGNVGIGTTSPSKLLDIQKSAPGGLLQARFWNNTTNTNGTESQIIMPVFNGAGGLYIRSMGSSGGGFNVGTYDGWIHTGQSASRLHLSGGNGSAKHLTIRDNGNIGIGTTSPNDLLHISKSGTNTRLRIGNNSAYDQLLYFNGAADWSMGMDNSNSNAFTIASTSSLDNSQRFTILSNGNTGIGTTAPVQKLHVNGNIKAGGDFTQSIFRLEATDEAGANAMAVGLQLHGYESRGKGIYITDKNTPDQWFIGEGYNYDGIGIGYSTSGQTEYNANTKFIVKNSGNVGIGNTSPSGKLHIEGDVFIKSGEKLQWGGPQTAIEGSTVSNKIALFTNNLERLRVDDGGNVGIGTTAPSHTLTIKGASGSGNNGINILDANSRIYFDGKRAMEGHVSNNRLDIGEGYSKTQIFGNVGMGVIDPSEKLEVNGTIRSKKVKVEASPWPDFVFAPSYELRSLSDLEKYITDNHHLPEVPSAVEVEKEGLDLGKMDATLLQKVEELTLYLIDVNKKQEQLIKEVADLKKENAALKKKVNEQ